MPSDISKLGKAIIGSTESNATNVLVGKFVSTEVVDTDLSKVTLNGGADVRWVPKFKSVGAMSVGDTVWLLSNGNSYVIIGVETGDRFLADSGM